MSEETTDPETVGARRFAGPDRRRLEVFAGEDSSVVFDQASGETHLLNALGMATLHCLEGAPLGFDELAERVSGELGVADAPALRGPLVGLLGRLESAGLVEVS